MEEVELEHVFISHYHKDEDNIRKLKDLIGNDYEIKNSSVTSDKFNRANNSDYIKKILRDRIRWAGKFICLIGPCTHDSSWVDYEIQTAHRMGKEIIGVYIYGAKDSDVPDALNNYADAIVGWNKDKIEEAIGGTSTFEKADGTVRPYGGTSRATC